MLLGETGETVLGLLVPRYGTLVSSDLASKTGLGVATGYLALPLELVGLTAFGSVRCGLRLGRGMSSSAFLLTPDVKLFVLE